MYIVLKNGEFFALTNEKSLNLEGATGTFTVRAANEMGGFGQAGSISTDIQNLTSAIENSPAVKTAIFSVSGTQQSRLQKGINIVVKTLADGSKETTKMIVK